MITRDDWLKALNEVGFNEREDDQGALSTMEFAAMLGLNRVTAERRLQILVREGKAHRTGKWAPCSDGSRRYLVAFRLNP